MAFGLPPVLVDRERVGHVFDNLIGNALAHTGRGGSVRVSAEADGGLRPVRRRGHRRGDPGRAPAAGLREVLPGARARGRRAGPGSAWRSPARSSRPTAARSTRPADPARGPPSPSPCRSPRTGTGPADRRERHHEPHRAHPDRRRRAQRPPGLPHRPGVDRRTTLAAAEDGEAALDWLGGPPFDLVLLDLQMPGIGGMEVLRRLRDAGNDVPVVIVTAHGERPRRRRRR